MTNNKATSYDGFTPTQQPLNQSKRGETFPSCRRGAARARSSVCCVAARPLASFTTFTETDDGKGIRFAGRPGAEADHLHAAF
ncbi:protein of unknown function [Paraburkholderia kururiensis]